MFVIFSAKPITELFVIFYLSPFLLRNWKLTFFYKIKTGITNFITISSQLNCSFFNNSVHSVFYKLINIVILSLKQITVSYFLLNNNSCILTTLRHT